MYIHMAGAVFRFYITYLHTYRHAYEKNVKQLGLYQIKKMRNNGKMDEAKEWRYLETA